jgi:hypothetical protein
MANKNLTQIPPQTGSADSTSLFYAVVGGNTDTSLPISVLVNNLGLTGIPTTPTAITSTNTTQIASTAFVQNVLGAYTVPITRGGTGATSASTARTNLGLGTAAVANTGTSGATVPLLNTANVFSANQQISSSSPVLTLNDSSGANAFGFLFSSNTNPLWQFHIASPGANNDFQIWRYSGGAFLDTPLAISYTTGQVSITDGLAVTGTVSGTGFSNYLASPPAIGSTTPSTGKFTTLTATSAAITGGTINGTTIGATTPSTGAFTTLSSTAGLTGTNTNNNAAAGIVGEYISNSNSTGVALTSNTPINIVSISLTAGDWDVEASMNITPAATTNVTFTQAGISPVSATLQTLGSGYGSMVIPISYTGIGMTMPIMTSRVSIATTTTIYLVISATFTTSTANGYGYLRARRVR